MQCGSPRLKITVSAEVVGKAPGEPQVVEEEDPEEIYNRETKGHRSGYQDEINSWYETHVGETVYGRRVPGAKIAPGKPVRKRRSRTIKARKHPYFNLLICNESGCDSTTGFHNHL